MSSILCIFLKATSKIIACFLNGLKRRLIKRSGVDYWKKVYLTVTYTNTITVTSTITVTNTNTNTITITITNTYTITLTIRFFCFMKKPFAFFAFLKKQLLF